MKSRQERLQHLFEELASKKLFNGAVLAAENGETIFESAYGFADLSTERKLTSATVFELASVSKPFTAIGIFILEEQGKIGYDDLIEQWLPALPYSGITIRHLLCHTSGIPDYMDLFFEHWDQSRIATNEDVMEMLIQHQPAVYFAPNESWAYSNTGYVLLALIIEKVTGQRFADYMHDNVFSPLGMNDTKVFNRRYSGERISNYAYGYVYDPNTDSYELPDHVLDTDYVTFLDGIQGDGTVNSNLGDLLKVDQALYGSNLISKHSLERAFAPVQLNNGESFDYGFGWILENKQSAGRIISHNGGWPGYSTMFVRYIDHNRTLIYLSNMEQEAEVEQAIFAAAENILYDLPYAIPEPISSKKIVKIDPALYEQYTGTYRIESGTGEDIVLLIATKADRLYMQITGKARVGLFPSSERRFFVRSIPVEVEFVTDVTGRANRLIIFQDGVEEHAVRM
jgi:CubicO group peptidase (beta-lactamase class C family)